MAESTIVLITREGLGTVSAADREFGLEMMDKLLHGLEAEAARPLALCFYTEGVHLVCEGSRVLLGLKLLEGLGVRILACQSCLEHYGLQDRVAVGEVGNMTQIVGLLMTAAKVVTV